MENIGRNMLHAVNQIYKKRISCVCIYIYILHNKMILIDRRECSATSSCLPRSSSIDSVAEWGLTGGVGTVAGNNSVSAGNTYGLFVEHPPLRRSPSPLLGARGDRLSLVSPNIGRRIKGHRAVVGKSLQIIYPQNNLFVAEQ